MQFIAMLINENNDFLSWWIAIYIKIQLIVEGKILYCVTHHHLHSSIQMRVI